MPEVGLWPLCVCLHMCTHTNRYTLLPTKLVHIHTKMMQINTIFIDEVQNDLRISLS